ncbi:glutaminyl-peptide cyclotransferase [Sediminibacterium soli]|uniref:glutaminyl-peptide cyclotransferase n=1 Tax=Sediminibacterium soli TaxID=2698829 RepID=UPI0013796BD9|nr:glutaminyl-peptide cyclotransferase [Sediminibacterium soli]NCI46184.1 glutaminyl-peptide cyclotransferase [Sediminibacterium soli]
MKKIVLPLVLVAAIACNNSKPDETNPDIPVTPAPASIGYSVIRMYPHDTSSYTQGLEWNDNVLYEGTGWVGKSKLLQTDYKSGKQTKGIAIDKSFFGEGITVMNDKIYQLTWENHKAFVYDLKTFKKLREFEWPFEGWGLTHNDTALIISTGESNLYFVDPETFRIKRTLGVTDNNGYVGDINELEYVDGMIYANIYGKDDIVKINPATGKVEGKLDLSTILAQNNVTPDPRKLNQGFVLNGIAYNKTTKTFFVTGKQWPVMFELRLQ